MELRASYPDGTLGEPVCWLGVVGSRRRQDRDAIVAEVRRVVGELRRKRGAVVGVVSGGARGPDTWAAAEARRQGWPVEEWLPDLSGLGQGAPRHEYTKRYYRRNEVVAERCEELLAFVAAHRRGGTEHTIREAERRGRPVRVVGPAAAVDARTATAKTVAP